MGYIAKLGDQRGLDAFLADLLESDSLTGEAARLARMAIDRGLDGLSSTERATLEADAIEPYCGDCETCGKAPTWTEMLHVYDTGLCSACFASLLAETPEVLGPQYLAYRPHADDTADEQPEESPIAEVGAANIAATA